MSLLRMLATTFWMSGFGKPYPPKFKKLTSSRQSSIFPSEPRCSPSYPNPSLSIFSPALHPRNFFFSSHALKPCLPIPISPLFCYFRRFIAWAKTTYPAGCTRVIVPLLERATRALQAEARYADDARYLRLWVQYADLLSEPGEVFLFLEHRGIGQNLALFYEAYATHLELRRNFASAEEVYQLGVHRRAHPLERLRTKHEAFKARMLRRKQREEAEAAQTGERTEAAPVRESLNEVRMGRGGARAPVPAAPSTIAGARLPSAFGPAPSGQQGGGLAIFVDDEFAGGATAGRPLGRGAAAVPPAAPWAQLATVAQGRKENEMKATAWAGAALGRPAATSAPPIAPLGPVGPLQIFEDEGLEAAAPGRAAASASALRPKAGEGREDELLQLDPLRFHRAPPPAAIPAPKPAAAVPAAKPKAEVRPAFDRALLVDARGRERSFEEVRYDLWRAQQAAQAQVQALRPALSPGEVSMESPGPLARGPEASPPHAHLHEPTINTRAAFAMINDLFGASLPHEAGRGPALTAPPSVVRHRDASPGVGAAGPIADSPVPAPGAAAVGGLAIYEDTAFLGRAGPAALAPEPAGLAVYEDTAFLPGPGAPRPDDVDLDDDRENAAPPSARGAAPPPRHPSEPLHLAALQPLTAQRRAALGGVAEALPSEALAEGEPLAHEALAAIPEDIEGDAFRVYDDASALEGMAGTPLPLGRPVEAAAASAAAAADGMDDDILADGSGTPYHAAAAGTWHGTTPLAGMLSAGRGADASGGSPGSMLEPGELEIAVLSVFDATVRPALVQSMEPAVGEWEGVRTCAPGEAAHVAQALAQARRTGSAALRVGALELLLKGREERAGCEVFAAVDVAAADGMGDDDDDEAAGGAGCAYLLKVVSPAAPWEFYACQALQLRAQPQLRSRFAQPTALILDPAGAFSILLLRGSTEGPATSLDHVMQAYRSSGQPALPEVLAAFYGAELLRTLAELHRCKLLHCAVSPASLVLRNDAERWEDWQPGNHGTWRDRGLRLLDFDRSMDLVLLGPESTTGPVLMQGDTALEGFRCPQMESGRPWLYSADLCGAAATLHFLVTGRALGYEEDAATGQVAARTALGGPASDGAAAGLQCQLAAAPLWNHVLQRLVGAPTEVEAGELLAELAAQLEQWIAGDAARVRAVKTLLLKQNILVSRAASG